jgi:hypothetical protein
VRVAVEGRREPALADAPGHLGDRDARHMPERQAPVAQAVGAPERRACGPAGVGDVGAHAGPGQLREHRGPGRSAAVTPSLLPRPFVRSLRKPPARRRRSPRLYGLLQHDHSARGLAAFHELFVRGLVDLVEPLPRCRPVRRRTVRPPRGCDRETSRQHAVGLTIASLGTGSARRVRVGVRGSGRAFRPISPGGARCGA